MAVGYSFFYLIYVEIFSIRYRGKQFSTYVDGISATLDRSHETLEITGRCQELG